MQCVDVAKGHSGSVNLTCRDAQLYASHNCEQTCRSDNTEVLLAFDGKQLSLQPPKEIPSRATDEVPCRDVFSGTLGPIHLNCENGILSAQEYCGWHRRCPAGLTILVSHESATANLQVSEGGLEGGSLSMYPCEDHFAGTTGSIGLSCYDGQLQASAQCNPRIECSEVPLWAIVASCAFSALISALCMFRCLKLKFKRQTQKSKNEKKYLSAIDPAKISPA